MSNKPAVAVSAAAANVTPARIAEATAAPLPAPGVQAEPGTPPARALPPHEAATNRELLVWMFGFLRPVKLAAVFASFYVALVVGTEVMTVRQTAIAVNHIQHLHHTAGDEAHTFWAWTWGTSPDARTLRHVIIVLMARMA